MRPQRKRTLSKVLIEAQETEAVRASPPKRSATNGKAKAFGGRPPLYPMATPLKRFEDTALAHPPVDAGIADDQWKSLCHILAESTRHEKGSGERSICLEELYNGLRKIYSARATCQESQDADGEHPHGDGARLEGDKTPELKVEDLVKGEEEAGWGVTVEEPHAEAPVDGDRGSEEECKTPSSEPLSNAETPTHQSPTHRWEKVAEKFEGEEAVPAPMRTRNRS